MTQAPSPQPLQFCELLREERSNILVRWEAAARAANARAAALDSEALLDHIPPLIDDIVDALTASAQGKEIRLTHDHPRQHAMHRLDLGFSLDVIAHEYALLREQMIERLYARLDAVPAESVKILHRFVDQAIIEAVVAFAEGAQQQRDYEQAQRSEFERHLLGIVSHDLRTPLQAITTSASLLLRLMDVDERQLRLLSGITSAVGRANRLIQDLLDFTAMRIGTGLAVIPTAVDLYELAQQAVTEMHVTHPEREIQLSHEGSLKGRWDGERMMQVFTNLLINALKYSSADSAIEVHLSGTNKEVRAQIHNMGPPITQEVQERLFQAHGARRK